ncbi:MAG: hypothetical protein ACMV1B_01395 [Prevotella sp.]
MSINDMSQEEALNTLNNLIERIQHAAIVADVPDSVEIFSDAEDDEGNVVRTPVVGTNREFFIHGMKAIISLLAGEGNITSEFSEVCQPSE